MRLASIMALVLSSSGPLHAAAPKAGKAHHTYPQPQPLLPQDPMRVLPGQQIPEHPEHYTWRISNKLPGGKVSTQLAVPLFRIKYLERPSRKGEIAVGTAIKLEHVTHLGSVIYYEVPAPNADPAKPIRDPDDMLWVNGMFIEPVAYTPPAK